MIDPDYSCEGKDPMTYAVAEKAAKRIKTRRQGKTPTPYKCPKCGHWHIGRDGSLK